MNTKNLFLLTILVAISGCGGPQAEVIEIEGVVTLNGQPLPEVMVTFLPDPEEGFFGRPSNAITDSAGKYRLKYTGGSPEFGAEVGKHRITIIDVMAENSRDNPMSARTASKYATAGKTDLRFEVLSGDKQSADFQVEPR